MKLEKLRRLLDQWTPDTPDVLLLISSLLGLEALDQPLHQDLSPKQRRIRTLAALLEMILELAA